MTNELPGKDAIRRRRDTAAAEYRHEWDYGPSDSCDKAFKRLVNFAAAVEAHTTLSAYSGNVLNPVETMERMRAHLASQPAFVNGLRLPPRDNARR